MEYPQVDGKVGALTHVYRVSIQGPWITKIANSSANSLSLFMKFNKLTLSFIDRLYTLLKKSSH